MQLSTINETKKSTPITQARSRGVFTKTLSEDGDITNVIKSINRTVLYL